MVGALVAGLIERQVRRVLANRKQPIKGLMPEGRDNLRGTMLNVEFSMMNEKKARKLPH